MKILREHEVIRDLVHNVEKLEKHRCETTRLVGDRLTAAVGEAMAERKPLLLYEHVQAVDGAVEGIHQDLGDGHDLQKQERVMCVTIVVFPGKKLQKIERQSFNNSDTKLSWQLNS